jgi:hypothetical protein
MGKYDLNAYEEYPQYAEVRLPDLGPLIKAATRLAKLAEQDPTPDAEGEK